MNHIKIDYIRRDAGISYEITDIIKETKLKCFGYMIYRDMIYRDSYKNDFTNREHKSKKYYKKTNWIVFVFFWRWVEVRIDMNKKSWWVYANDYKFGLETRPNINY